MEAVARRALCFCFMLVYRRWTEARPGVLGPLKLSVLEDQRELLGRGGRGAERGLIKGSSRGIDVGLGVQVGTCDANNK